MNVKNEILKFIIYQLNSYQKEGIIESNLTFNDSTLLYGAKGVIDSFNLVGLIVDLEEFINSKFNKNIIIANEKVFSLKKSPFINVDTLADYTTQLLKNES